MSVRLLFLVDSENKCQDYVSNVITTRTDVAVLTFGSHSRPIDVVADGSTCHWLWSCRAPSNSPQSADVLLTLFAVQLVSLRGIPSSLLSFVQHRTPLISSISIDTSCRLVVVHGGDARYSALVEQLNVINQHTHVFRAIQAVDKTGSNITTFHWDAHGQKLSSLGFNVASSASYLTPPTSTSHILDSPPETGTRSDTSTSTPATAITSTNITVSSTVSALSLKNTRQRCPHCTSRTKKYRTVVKKDELRSPLEQHMQAKHERPSTTTVDAFSNRAVPTSASAARQTTPSSAMTSTNTLSQSMGCVTKEERKTQSPERFVAVRENSYTDRLYDGLRGGYCIRCRNMLNHCGC